MERKITKAALALDAQLATGPNAFSHLRCWYRKTQSPGRIPSRVLVALAFFCLLPAAAAPIQYLYDELGRVTGVIDAAGTAATYSYDAAGNILCRRAGGSGFDRTIHSGDRPHRYSGYHPRHRF